MTFILSAAARCGFRVDRVSVLILAGIGLVITPGQTQGVGPGPEGPADARPVSFRVPPGFVAERVAGPPLVSHPMFACFDDRGRLYVADSTGDNPSGDDLGKNPPHRIRRLEDTDGDGRFDKGLVFADRMTYPQGVLWHDGAIFTASPPSLWRLEDSDGDGVADRRRELVTGWVLTGVADELHGPSLGPDGRIYWFCGRFPHEIRRPGGPVIRKGRAPLILRVRPDGRDVEILSGAHGNPVKAAFTPEGEPLVCGTWSGSHGDRQDVIIHCVEGGDYPVLDGDFHEHKRTGGLLPPLTKLGVAAASGVMRYRGESFPPEFRGNLFSALFNMHKILRHVVERDGATFRSRDQDFLVSDQPDFHPTDVLEDADGSILVVDTGSWFSHCPTSRLGRGPVSGGIYRVRREGAAPAADPRGLALDWGRLDPRELVRLFDDPRGAVRDRAVEEAARHGTGAIDILEDVLREAGSTRVRLNAVWALARIEGEKARAAARRGLDDKDLSVRLAAATAAGLHRDQGASLRLRELVGSDAAPIRREAATALGRLRGRDAVPSLLTALRAGGDRFLDHALIYALITIDDREATLPGLQDPSPLVRRGALIALDQMDGGGLTRDLVMPLLECSDLAVQHAVLEVIAGRTDWARAMIGWLRRELARAEREDSRHGTLLEELLAFCRDSEVQDLIARSLRLEATPVGTRLLLLEVIARAPLDRLPPTWAAELRWCLDHRDERVVRQSVAILRAAGVAEYDDALLRVARDRQRPADARVDALAAVAPRLSRLDPPLFGFLGDCLTAEQPVLLRLSAAGVLGRAPLDESQLDALTEVVSRAGAMEISRLLPAYERTSSGAIGAKLVTALARSPGRSSLTFEAVRQALKDFPDDVRHQAEPILKGLEADRVMQAARLAELEPMLARGDTSRGHEIFFGQKAACTLCHSAQGQGGHVGPDLSKIGAIRTGRDLLESIVYPSASFARGFEPYVIATQDGRVHSGILARETSEAIELVAPDRSQVRLGRATIQEVAQSRVSIMPQGLDAQLDRQELADLIAFLRSLK
jgi:putative membrane-bound dehydrogenase-like protein